MRRRYQHTLPVVLKGAADQIGATLWGESEAGGADDQDISSAVN